MTVELSVVTPLTGEMDAIIDQYRTATGLRRCDVYHD